MKATVYMWVLAAALCCGGCEKGKPTGQSAEKELILYCGAGLREPVTKAIEAFEQGQHVKVAPDYAGSETLLGRIKVSQRGDLYLPGDAYYTEQAQAAGLLAGQATVCYFVPMILVQKDNPKKIQGLSDLLKPGVKLGLGDATTCAVGRISRQIFEKNGVVWADVEKHLTYKSLTVNDLGIQIKTGRLDAVIVWDAVARLYGEAGEAVAIAPQDNVISTVVIGILNSTSQRAAAQRFVEFITSPQGQAIFQQHGYAVKRPE